MGVSFSRIRPLLQITEEGLSLDIVVGQAVVRLQRAGEATVFQTAQALETQLSNTTLLSELFRYFSGEAFAEIEPDGWRIEIGSQAACTTLWISSDEANSIMRYVAAECRSILQSISESAVDSNAEIGNDETADDETAEPAKLLAPANSEISEADESSADSDPETFADSPPPPKLTADEFDWNFNFERLCRHVRETGGITQMDQHLYEWCCEQKTRYMQLRIAGDESSRNPTNMLTAAQLELLAEIPGWDWRAHACGAQMKEITLSNILSIWHAMFNSLREHVSRTGSLANMSPKLYDWCTTIAASTAVLSPAQITAFSDIPEWNWDKPAGGATLAEHQPVVNPLLMNYSRAEDATVTLHKPITHSVDSSQT